MIRHYESTASQHKKIETDARKTQTKAEKMSVSHYVKLARTINSGGSRSCADPSRAVARRERPSAYFGASQARVRSTHRFSTAERIAASISSTAPKASSTVLIWGAVPAARQRTK
jgi:hypothetical protein